MLLLKQTPEVEHEHIEPANADLALIRQYARRDVKEEEVYVGAMHGANTKLDRAGEKFTKAYLQRFAETLPGKPTLEGHDTTKRPNGRIYKAEVLPDGDGWFLKTYYYLRADSPWSLTSSWASPKTFRLATAPIAGCATWTAKSGTPTALARTTASTSPSRSMTAEPAPSPIATPRLIRPKGWR